MTPFAGEGAAARARREPLIPSDALATIRDLAVFAPALRPLFGNVPTVSVIVDANVVLDEIAYLVASRRDPAARTALQELSASGTVIVYAPLTLKDEVERHLGKLAVRRRVEMARLHAVWTEYQATLRFFEPDPPPPEVQLNAIDPNDLPYTQLWAQLGARAVYSNDRHVAQMGAPVVHFELFLSLRDYARAASVELTIKFGAGFALAVSIDAVVALAKLAAALARGVARLPREAQVVLALVIAALLLHPASRKAIQSKVQALPTLLRQTVDILGPLGARLSDEFVTSHRDASSALEAAERRLPPSTRRRTVQSRARAACAASEEPLSIEAIEARMRADGYAPSARGARRYLMRVLQRDPRLVEATPGRWTVRRAPDKPA